MRQLAYDRQPGSPEAEWSPQMREAHNMARAQYERLRLSTDSLRTQEEARYALRYAFGLRRQLEGKPPRVDEQERAPLDQMEDRLVALYVEVRRELGVPNPRRVLPEMQFQKQFLEDVPSQQERTDDAPAY